jgi:cytidylate kinase
MVIAIDGPAGSGKSTVARKVAARLGYQYVDTGAMYRAVAHAALEQGISLSESPRVEQLAASLDLRFEHGPRGDRLLAAGRDVTEAIRAPEVAQAASVVSAIPGVRRAMVALQRGMGREHQIVMEGRDIGTVVFPDARFKIYLDAAPEKRGKRRWMETGGDLAQVIESIRQRDARDREREHSPLRRAADAYYLDTTNLTEDEAVEEILAQVSRGSV